MKGIIYTKGIALLLVLVLFSLIFNHCQVDFFDDNPSTNGDTGVVVGIVTDMQEQGLADVEVSAAGQQVYSATDGTFLLANIPTGEKKTITFSLDGYATSQKVAKVAANDTAYVSASMDKWGRVTDIAVNQDNTVTFQNASVKLPANGIVDENGQAVSGNVTVSAAWFDPTDPNYGDVFPGDFSGEDSNGNEVAIESFGFITVEITQGDMELDLAPGKSSEITIPVPASIQSNAPATIPLWYFDEEQGFWIEEGSATLQNGAYVGSVNHFSYWNADKEMETSILKGRVVCDDGTTPVPDALVTVIGLDFAWSTMVLTDAQGWYEFPVKSDSKVKVRARRLVDWDVVAYSKWEVVNTAPALGMITVPDLLVDCSDEYSFIYDIYSWDLVAAWAVGENGTILERFYTGSLQTPEWVKQLSGTVQALYAIDCPSYDNLWVVGSKGTVLNSTDRSQTWNLVDIGTIADLYDVEFYDGYYGWIVGAGGVMFRTTNRGQNWTSLVYNGTVDTLKSCSFVSPLEGWVCGTVIGTNGIILHTQDGGDTWEHQNSHVPEDLNSICFIDRDNGWAVGDNGRITRTTDGGKNWIPQASGTMEDLKGIDMHKVKNGGGYIVGNNGVGLDTWDSGDSWDPDILLDIPNNINIEAVDVSNDGWVRIGGGNQFYTTVTKSPDITAGWRKQSSVASDTLWGVKAVSNTEAWVVGNSGMLLHTENSGNTWNNKTFINKHLYVVEQSGSHVWIGGKDGFWLSNDNGTSWSDANFLPPGKSIIKLQFTDGSNGWALVSDDAPYYDLTFRIKTVYKTTDGGQNWALVNTLPLGPSSTYDDIHFIDANTGWITDLNDALNQHYPTLYSTNDGGINWTSEEFPISYYTYYTEVFSLDGSKVWFNDGYFQKSEKEIGKQWNSTSFSLHGTRYLTFVNNSNAFAIAEPDLLYYSQNGGKTWLHSGDQNGNKMYGVTCYDMFDEQYGWLVDYKGNIFFTNTGGH